VTRGYLGVQIQDLTDDLASSLHLKSTKGALVAQVVQGGPADKAGVKQGDVISAFNNTEIKESHELSSLVAGTPIDREVPLRVVREGKELTLQVRTGRLASQEAVEPKAEQVSQGKWGLQLQELNPEQAAQMGLNGRQGVLVAGVQPGSPADNASVQRGDVVLEVNRQPVKNVGDVKEKIEKSGSKESLLLLIQRGTNSLYVALKG